ncbi:hypothetical protein [Polaromonas sp.]|uniref:hypothetical protein n=1 Tax=Polaromonas sp. TaxID=1869339 RepID=UPI003FA6C05A
MSEQDAGETVDLVRQVLEPAGIKPARRTTELAIAMLQLWAVQSYLDRGYVTARPAGPGWRTLWRSRARAAFSP